MLGREFLGERVVGVRAHVLLEFIHGLLAQDVTVHQEEDALGFGELDQAVAERAGGVGLPGAGGHLDEGAGTVLLEGFLQVADGGDLSRPQPLSHEVGETLDVRSQLAIGFCQAEQFLRPVEGKDLPTTGVRVKTVGELGLLAGGLVGEG